MTGLSMAFFRHQMGEENRPDLGSWRPWVSMDDRVGMFEAIQKKHRTVNCQFMVIKIVMIY